MALDQPTDSDIPPPSHSSLSPPSHGDPDPQSTVDIICKYWSHPKGHLIPAVVLTMNHFVNRVGIQIPCEIAMASFTIEKGITDSYCTIVDPIETPLGTGIEVTNNAEKYGLPQPPFNPATQFQDYGKIVKEIDSFIDRFSANQEDIKAFIFCMTQDMKSIKGGLEWLYEKVGKKFNYKLIRLEMLLVVLTLGGLEKLSLNRKDDWGLADIISAFDTAVSHMSTVSKSTGSSSAYPKSGISEKSWNGFSNLLKDGEKPLNGIKAFSKISGLCSTSYTSIGKSSRSRVAYKKQADYPYAMLGGFTLEQQAKDYLNQSEFLHLENLACCFHQGKVGFRGQEETVPRERLTHCALVRVKSQLYLALDALVVNYGIQGKQGFHYPSDDQDEVERKTRKKKHKGMSVA